MFDTIIACGGLSHLSVVSKPDDELLSPAIVPIALFYPDAAIDLMAAFFVGSDSDFETEVGLSFTSQMTLPPIWGSWYRRGEIRSIALIDSRWTRT